MDEFLDKVLVYEDKDIVSSKILSKDTDPYIITERVVKIQHKKYNPNYGDNRVCKCGHSYYRHFDSWENMAPCGCKYCICDTFEETTKNN